jgi:hypothetical protein
MKKIVAFGDSYVNYDWIDIKEHNWVDYLGKILNLPVLNYGISGSGLGYAMDSFVKYTNSNEYFSEDIIIFVTSSDQRLYTSNMYNARLGSKIIQRPEWKLEREDEVWLKENGESALWAIMNLYDPKINYELIKTLSFLQTWAQHRLSNTLIVIRAFGKDVSNGHDIEKLTELIKFSENFFPLIDSDTTLGQISTVEYSKFHLRTLHQQYWKGIDYRINHLSQYHRMELAKMISNVISTKSASAVDFSWIQRNSITSTDQFEFLPTYYH